MTLLMCSAFAVRDDGTKTWCFMLHGHSGEHRFLASGPHRFETGDDS